MTIKNSLITAAGLAGLLFGMPSAAQGAEQGDDSLQLGSIGGSVTFSTDYRFRGISNSNNRPQIQGDLNWSHPVGVYAGIWSTNTNFGGDGNSMELDPYIGYATAFGDSGFSIDLGYWWYTYPGATSDLDFAELYAIGTYAVGDFSVSPSAWYTDNYFGEDFLDGVSGLAYDVTVSWSLPRDFSLSARVGEQTFGSGGEGLDYIYYDAGVSKSWGDLTLDLRWVDTGDVDDTLTAGDSDLAKGEAMLTVTHAF